MKVLLDTNVLTRLTNSALLAVHDLAEVSVEKLRAAGHVPCLVPQNFYEFWTVATRPLESNGLGMTTREAREEVDELLSLFLILQDERAIFPRWLELVTDHDVKGKPAHDARLVAAMHRHGLSHLLSFNPGDFSRYPTVICWKPEDIVSGTATLM